MANFHYGGRVRRVFLGPNGVRSGWKIALWIVGSLLLSIPPVVIAIWATHLDPRALAHAPPRIQMAVSAMGVFPALLLTWAFARVFDHAGFASVGLGPPMRAAARELALGTALGAVLLGTGFAVDACGGGASVVFAHPSPLRFAAYLFSLLLAAASEELSFRGVPFQSLVRGIGPAAATALAAAAFGAIHLLNEGMTAFGAANIVAAGVLLSLALFARGNLWFPVGLHFGWNAMQGMVLGVPISGNIGYPSLAKATLEGPVWRTGGEFGVEGSIGSLVAVAIGCAFFAWHLRRWPRASVLP